MTITNQKINEIHGLFTGSLVSVGKHKCKVGEKLIYCPDLDEKLREILEKESEIEDVYNCWKRMDIYIDWLEQYDKTHPRKSPEQGLDTKDQMLIDCWRAVKGVCEGKDD